MIMTDEKFDIYEEKLMSFIPDERRKKVNRYYFDVDRRLSLYAWLNLEYALKNENLTDICNLRFGKGKCGKPYLVDYPDIHFNISHTKNAVFCAVSNEGEIGADTEKIVFPPYEIINSCFSDDEINYMNSKDDEHKKKAFFEIWTKKEAYLKKDGTGLVRNLKKIDSLKSNNVFYYTFFKSDYVFSVCTDNEEKAELCNVTEILCKIPAHVNERK